MRKLALLLSTVCLLQARTVQPIFGGFNSGASNLQTTGVSYEAIIPFNNQSTIGTAANSYVVWPSTGAFMGCSAISINQDPGAGASWTFAIYIEGSTTSVAITITHSNYTAPVALCTGYAPITAGQRVAVQVTPSSSPAPVATHYTSCWIFSPAKDGETVEFGGVQAGGAPSGTTYMYIGFDGGGATTQDKGRFVAPSSGSIYNLYAYGTAALGAGNQMVYTLQYGSGAAAPTNSSLTTTISGGSQVSNQDTTHTVTVTAGDNMDMVFVTSGSGLPNPYSNSVSFVFLPNTYGQFWILGEGLNQSLATQTNYGQLLGRPLIDNTEAHWQFFSSVPFTAQAVYCWWSTDPGSGKSYDVYFNSANATPSAVHVNVPHTTAPFVVSTTGQSVAVAANALISSKFVPNSSPTAQTTASVSYLGYIPPTGKFLGMF
jgi:hypothetical protein